MNEHITELVIKFNKACTIVWFATMFVAALASIYLLITSQMFALGYTSIIMFLSLLMWLLNVTMLSFLDKNEINVDKLHK